MTWAGHCGCEMEISPNFSGSIVLLRGLERKNSFHPQPGHSEEAALQSAAAPQLIWTYGCSSFDQRTTVSESQCAANRCASAVCVTLTPSCCPPACPQLYGPIHNSHTEDWSLPIKHRSSERYRSALWGWEEVQVGGMCTAWLSTYSHIHTNT